MKNSRDREIKIIFLFSKVTIIYLELLNDVGTVLETRLRLRTFRQRLQCQETHLPAHKTARCTFRTYDGQCRKVILCIVCYSYALKNICKREFLQEGEKVVKVRLEPITQGGVRDLVISFFNFLFFSDKCKAKIQKQL